MTHIGRLRGHWRRSLIVWPDGRQDTTTDVDWLQGPSLYVDLRQPDGQLHFDGVACLRDLARGQAVAMAAQEAFAGTLVQHPDHFEWTRLIDFQPPAKHDDRGTLVERHGMLVEEGYGISYIEHWHRQAGTASAAAISARAVESRCTAIMVRAGDRFMYARSRPIPAEADRSLADSVRAASSHAAAQDLVDCEISLGSVSNLWTIARSTLPWRVGTSLHLSRDGVRLVTGDVSPDGKALQRLWAICAEQGDFLDTAASPQLRAVEA